jgi:hypothetical protein
VTEPRPPPSGTREQKTPSGRGYQDAEDANRRLARKKARKEREKKKRGWWWWWWQERGLGYGQTNNDTNKELVKGIQRGKGQRMRGRDGMDGRDGGQGRPGKG